MDALIVANMLFVWAAGTGLIVVAAVSALWELRRQLESRGWSATGEIPSVLELLEGPHSGSDAASKPATKPEKQPEARYA